MQGREPGSWGARFLIAAQVEHPPMENHAGRHIETGREARAGFLDRPVLVVLSVSTAAIIIVFGLLWLGYFGGA
jgi:hypothetical protein